MSFSSWRYSQSMWRCLVPVVMCVGCSDAPPTLEELVGNYGQRHAEGFQCSPEAFAILADGTVSLPDNSTLSGSWIGEASDQSSGFNVTFSTHKTFPNNPDGSYLDVSYGLRLEHGGGTGTMSSRRPGYSGSCDIIATRVTDPQ